MRILVVDDAAYKIKSIVKTLKSINGINEDDIDYVIDLNNARKKVVDIKYNYLILDVNISETIEGEPSRHAGLSYLDELLQVDSMQKPDEIIILTEYDDITKHINDSGNYNAFTHLRYDSSSVYWSDVIKAKVEYGLNKEKMSEAHYVDTSCDVAIITAVEVETSTVSKLIENWEEISIKNDPTIYSIGSLKSTDKELRIIRAQQNEMGMSAAAMLTSKIMFHFNPRYIILVGIAAGIDNNCHFGDIIVPCEVWNYSSGKYQTNNGAETIFLPDPKHIQLDLGVREIFTKHDFSTVLAKIKRDFMGTKPTHEISLITNPMACGAAVVASSEIAREMILQHSRKTVGLDMESYGFFYAANNISTNHSTPICVKAICDFADDKKNDSFQQYAAYTSAQFAKHLICNILFM